MARPQPDCAVELLGGWNPIESLRFVKGHRRSLPGMILAIAFLLLAVVSITSLIAHPAESAQIVLTERSAIQVVDISSGVIKDLFRSHGDVHPICLPGGKGIAFVRFVGSGPKGTHELFVLDQAKKEPTQITFGMDVKIRFAASPDGQQLAYVSNRTKQVYVVRIDTPETTQLTNTFRGVNEWSGPQAPVWSPDGKRLALASFERMPYETSFHVLDTVTRQVVAIPFTPANLPDTWSPWSPDGTKLMLGAMGRTMIVDVANNPARLVREVTGYLRSIHWSPDGTKLAYEYGKEGRYCDDVYVMDIQKGVPRRVNAGFLEYRCFHGPSWSPDSKNLAFLGFYSRGDMSIFPWPDTILDQVYIADNNFAVRQLTQDLKQSNTYG